MIYEFVIPFLRGYYNSNKDTLIKNDRKLMHILDLKTKPLPVLARMYFRSHGCVHTYHIGLDSKTHHANKAVESGPTGLECG